jgi:hypothetical protein
MFGRSIKNLEFRVTGLDEFIPLLDNLKEKNDIYKIYKGYSFFKRYTFTKRAESDHSHDVVSFALNRDIIVGYCYFMFYSTNPEDEPAYHLIGIETKKGWRHKGIASRLLKNFTESKCLVNNVIRVYDC